MNLRDQWKMIVGILPYIFKENHTCGTSLVLYDANDKWLLNVRQDKNVLIWVQQKELIYRTAIKELLKMRKIDK